MSSRRKRIAYSPDAARVAVLHARIGAGLREVAEQLEVDNGQPLGRHARMYGEEMTRWPISRNG
jgi:hypothetical protein